MLTFFGSTSRQILQKILSSRASRRLENWKWNYHVGVNDIINDNSKQNTQQFWRNIQKTVDKCKSFAVQNVFVSALVFFIKVPLPTLEKFVKSWFIILVFLVLYVLKIELWGSEFSSFEIELQSRVTQNDVTLLVTNSKCFKKILFSSY